MHPGSAAGQWDEVRRQAWDERSEGFGEGSRKVVVLLCATDSSESRFFSSDPRRSLLPGWWGFCDSVSAAFDFKFTNEDLNKEATMQVYYEGSCILRAYTLHRLLSHDALWFLLMTSRVAGAACAGNDNSAGRCPVRPAPDMCPAFRHLVCASGAFKSTVSIEATSA